MASAELLEVSGACLRSVGAAGLASGTGQDPKRHAPKSHDTARLDQSQRRGIPRRATSNNHEPHHTAAPTGPKTDREHKTATVGPCRSQHSTGNQPLTATNVRSEKVVYLHHSRTQRSHRQSLVALVTQRKCRALLAAIVALLQMRHGCCCLCVVITAVSVASVACCSVALLRRSRARHRQKARN